MGHHWDNVRREIVLSERSALAILEDEVILVNLQDMLEEL